MADKDLDRHDANWLSNKFGKYAPINRVLVTKQAFTDTLEGSAVILAGLATITTLAGIAINPIDQAGIAPQDLSIAYTDQGDGYEIFTYAEDKPSIAVVRDGDNVRLYEVRKGNAEQKTTATWTMIQDEETASLLALDIESRLRARAENLSLEATTLNPNDDLSPITISHYDKITAPWINEDGQIQRSSTSDVQVISIPIGSISTEFTAEAQEWHDVRAQIHNGHYTAPTQTQLADMGEQRTLEDRRIDAVISGGLTGGSFGFAAWLTIFGACFSSHYGRRKREEKEKKAYTR